MIGRRFLYVNRINACSDSHICGNLEKSRVALVVRCANPWGNYSEEPCLKRRSKTVSSLNSKKLPSTSDIQTNLIHTFDVVAEHFSY